MMKFSRSVLCAAIAGLCVTSAFAAPKKPAAKAEAPKAVAVDTSPVTEIELVHSLGADKGAQLQKLVDRYNAGNNGPKIVIHDRAWNTGTLPHMMILGERDLPGFLSGAIPAFAHTVGEFGVVLMIGGNIPDKTRVVSVQIYDHVEALEYAQSHWLAGCMVVFSFLVLLMLYTLNPQTARGREQ